MEIVQHGMFGVFWLRYVSHDYATECRDQRGKNLIAIKLKNSFCYLPTQRQISHRNKCA